MRMLILFLCAALVVSNRTFADNVTVEFTGHITEIGAVLPGVEGVDVGTSFEGRYVIDVDREPRGLHPGFGAYSAESLQLAVGPHLVDVPASSNPLLASGVADVFDNRPSRFGYSNADSLSIRFTESGAFGTHNLVWLDFVDPTGTALSSNELIVAPDLNVFDGILTIEGQEQICFDNFDFACLPLETDLRGVITTVVIVPDATGDFNADGKVDAADYVVWRKNGISNAHYESWSAQFGGNGVASATTQPVPEPHSLWSACFLVATMFVTRALPARP